MLKKLQEIAAAHEALALIHEEIAFSPGYALTRVHHRSFAEELRSEANMFRQKADGD